MRRTSVLGVPALALAVVASGAAPTTAWSEPAAKRRYVVVIRQGQSTAQARAALADASARIVTMNDRVGVATIESGSPDLAAELMGTGLFTGVARDRAIGRAGLPLGRVLEQPATRPRLETTTKTLAGAPPRGGDPFARYQWSMNMIDADFGGSYAVERGDRRVLVGILDSGLEASHPDIRRNLDRGLSRNFTRDIRALDGPCREETDRSCDDSPLTDPGGHGTFVGSIVAAPLNEVGISGVAPNVKLVNLRVGQDSGFILVQPVVDALTYAADNGIDVANMSFFIDPWLYNCPSNPADSPEAQQEQQTIIAAVQAAVDYARSKNVTLVSATGNEWTDLANPTVDDISPDFPPGAAYERQVDNSCLQLPVEADGVIGVSAVGPSGRKAWYSNYGIDATDLAAAGGDDFDPVLPFYFNSLPGAFSTEAMREFGLLDRRGRPTLPFFKRRCSERRCYYYLFGAGTSFASPAVSGVAALIVSAHGTDDGAGGLTMSPDEVEDVLLATATPHPCPPGGVQEYPEIGDSLVEFGLPTWEAFTATCTEGPGTTNSFFGHGLVNAMDAVTHGP